jgi:signal transduction histidine kinase
MGAYARHSVAVEQVYESVPQMLVDKHKVLQILVNLFQNAKYVCDEGNPAQKKVVVRILNAGPERVRIEVTDNGIGIPPENLTRIFSQGFTTRRAGHGFGLHTGALAAKELGGSLSAASEGPGKGATFTLELPLNPKG